MGPLFLCAITALLLGMAIGRQQPKVWLALTLFATLASGTAGLTVLLSSTDWEWRSLICLGGEPIHLRLDGLSALFLVLLSVGGSMGAIYSTQYWSEKDYPNSAPRGRIAWCALLLMMMLILTLANGLHFLIAWELFAVSGYFLITLENQKSAVRSAGWLYLAASHAGTLCLFAFFSVLATRTGSWELGPMRDNLPLAPLFWLVILGFGIKAGLFPLHVWLPSAHANAPSHVSAILSGVAIKMGVYGIIRFSGWLPMPDGAGWVILGLGMLSALLGISFALAQNDYKRLLAYCSVENVGIILMGLGIALIARAHGHSKAGWFAIAGALLHIWNHGFFKILLFLGAGSVLHATGTREMSRLGGLWQRMPWTAAFFAMGAIAVSALPPLNGFVSEWLIYLGLFEGVVGKGPVGWAALPTTLVLAISGALALAAFAKATGILFLGAPRTQAARTAHECGIWMRLPMGLLAGLCLLIGCFPILLWPAISHAATSWNPQWTEGPAPVSLSSISFFNPLLAVLMVTATGLFFSKVRSNGLRRALTWDCGFARPTAHMQYTSGSLSGLAARWFRWILLPARNVRRPRGFFPVKAYHLERTPETVLERVLEPAGNIILFISSRVRRLQHGRLQTYILYLLAGLLALGMILYCGG
jgi:hydrogenase-4 component B